LISNISYLIAEVAVIVRSSLELAEGAATGFLLRLWTKERVSIEAQESFLNSWIQVRDSWQGGFGVDL
jgi:hypothetical protein